MIAKFKKQGLWKKVYNYAKPVAGRFLKIAPFVLSDGIICTFYPFAEGGIQSTISNP